MILGPGSMKATLSGLGARNVAGSFFNGAAAPAAPVVAMRPSNDIKNPRPFTFGGA